VGERWVRAGVWDRTDGMPQLSGDRPAQGAEGVAIMHGRTIKKRWNGHGLRGLWTYGVERGDRHHPTTKPLGLMLRLVEIFTDPGDLVLDPFCGSGTTGVACIRLGRRFIGIEKDATYAAVARERLEAESKGLTLRDTRAGPLPMFGDKS
jgi:site-specific DNA-methyltransferase (adenine-specific)